LRLVEWLFGCAMLLQTAADRVSAQSSLMPQCSHAVLLTNTILKDRVGVPVARHCL
jgi:hypothetical protein